MKAGIRSSLLAAGLALSLASGANAMVVPGPVGNDEGAIIKIAQGCGAGFWRGPHGRCHP